MARYAINYDSGEYEHIEHTDSVSIVENMFKIGMTANTVEKKRNAEEKSA